MDVVLLSQYDVFATGKPLRPEALVVPGVELPSGWIRLPDGEKKEILGVS